MKLNLVYVLTLLSSRLLLGQDTLLLDKKSEYFHETDNNKILEHYVKANYYLAKYSMELIKFSSDSFKTEMCFYYDQIRYTDSRKTSYKLSHDTLIQIDYGISVEKWVYKKIADSLFELHRDVDRFVEIGIAKSLIPLIKIGTFKTITKDANWVLWETMYKDWNPKIILPTYNVEGKIFTKKELDYMPTSNNIEIDLETLFIDNFNKYTPYELLPSIDFRSSKYYQISVTMTKEGKFVNMTIFPELNNPFTMMEIVKSLNKLDKIEPGKKNNEFVNVKYELEINLK